MEPYNGAAIYDEEELAAMPEDRRMALAVQEYNERKQIGKCLGFRTLAKRYKVNYGTLRNRTKKRTGSRGAPTIFTRQEEEVIANLLIEVSECGWPMDGPEIRKAIFEIADRSNSQWRNAHEEQTMAGRAWFSAFRARHPNITRKRTEKLSYARAIGFNIKAVGSFYIELKGLLDRFPDLTAEDINNSDESGFQMTAYSRYVSSIVKVI